MSCVFISGIPAAGKSYLAERVARACDARHAKIDDWVEEFRSDPKLEPWVDFYWNQDEKKYFKNTTCEKQWENLKKQSEMLWPAILEKIREVEDSDKDTIFEGVNILPRLARRDLDFDGIVLLGESYELILDRNKKSPRWGETEELQILEASTFWNCERLYYETEAKKYGFKTFSDTIVAEKELLRLLS
ncbi:MAG: hypothetical protein AAB631_00905 [Patescibacteria group bacterium]